MPKNSCIMQIWAESGKSALPICNYSQILYQFLTFTQNLKRSLTIPFFLIFYQKLNFPNASRLQTAGFLLYSFNNLYYSLRPHIGQYSISIPLMNTGKLLMPMLISSVLLSLQLERICLGKNYVNFLNCCRYTRKPRTDFLL